jgi:uncharacterized protein
LYEIIPLYAHRRLIVLLDKIKVLFVKKVLFVLFIIACAIYLLLCLVLYVWQDKILFLPEPLPSDYQYVFRSRWLGSSEEFALPTHDHQKINLVWLKPKSTPKGVILYCHGNAGNIQRWASIVDDLLQYDYEVMLWDYRTYGKSTGKLTEDNLLKDAQLVYDFAKKHFSEDKILLYGRSLGTGIATYLSAVNSPQLLILETPYYNLKDVAGTHFPYFPYALLLKYELKTNEWINEVRCPIYIFHGTYDRTVPYRSGLKLKEYLKPQDQFITIEAGDHNDLNTFHIYEEKIREILAK